ncbi:MAG: KpsF/GutQ family sugar-phosphate isomerase, partial [bacterium]
LASIGIASYFVHAGEAAHGDLGIVTEDDVVIAFSKSGRTEELLCLIPQLKRLGVKLIVVTAEPQSPLAEQANLVVPIPVEKEGEPFGIIPTTSAVAMLAFGDAIAVHLMKMCGFDKNKLAVVHPAGNIGRMLKPVSEIMHKGDEIPIVDESATLIAAIIEMTSKKLGVTLIARNGDELVGIYTDGDIRRTLQRNPADNLLNRKVIEFATLNPKTIPPTTIVEEAIYIMEKNKITSLPVVSPDNKILGIVHLHDLIQLKTV